LRANVDVPSDRLLLLFLDGLLQRMKPDRHPQTVAEPRRHALPPFFCACLARTACQTATVEPATDGRRHRSKLLHGFRHRFGEIVREEVARLVSDPSEVDDELAYLIRMLGEASMSNDE